MYIWFEFNFYRPFLFLIKHIMKQSDSINNRSPENIRSNVPAVSAEEIFVFLILWCTYCTLLLSLLFNFSTYVHYLLLTLCSYFCLCFSYLLHLPLLILSTTCLLLRPLSGSLLIPSTTYIPLRLLTYSLPTPYTICLFLPLFTYSFDYLLIYSLFLALYTSFAHYLLTPSIAYFLNDLLTPSSTYILLRLFTYSLLIP